MGTSCKILPSVEACLSTSSEISSTPNSYVIKAAPPPAIVLLKSAKEPENWAEGVGLFSLKRSMNSPRSNQV